MQKSEIILSLTNNHKQFAVYTNALLARENEFAPEGKWSAAQQVQHIYKSVRPLAQGLLLPKFLVKLIWGKTNRESKSYDGLINKYNEKLQLGGRASSPFVPEIITADKVAFWNKKIEKAVKQLNKNIEKYSEKDLDLYILPHPLLGKVTLREMLYFTMYHVQHHQQLISIGLEQLKD